MNIGLIKIAMPYVRRYHAPTIKGNTEMPRISLKNVSVATIQAELQRRQSQLPALIAQRDALDRQIGELQPLAEEAAPAPAMAPGRKAGRKAKPKKTKAGRKRGKPTAEEMILELLKRGGPLVSSAIAVAWKAEGRNGQPGNALNRLVKAKKVKREKNASGRGSEYSIA